jgi:hypothetical protein
MIHQLRYDRAGCCIATLLTMKTMQLHHTGGSSTRLNAFHSIGGSGEKKGIFQIAPTPYLSILICSNRYQYDFLKVLLKNKSHNLPVGYVKY